MAGTGTRITSEVKCFTKDDKLIVRFRSDNPFERYEHWRVKLCFDFKEDNLPYSFRHGDLTPLTLLRAIKIYLKYKRKKEVQNGGSIESNHKAL